MPNPELQQEVKAIILTALPQERVAAEVAFLDEKSSIDEQTPGYTIGKIQKGTRILIVETGMYPTKAAIAANTYASEYPQAERILFSGIAGGNAARGIKLGDIVVSDQNFFTGRGKSRDKARGKSKRIDFEWRSQNFPSDPRLLSHLEEFERRKLRGEGKVWLNAIKTTWEKLVSIDASQWVLPTGFDLDSIRYHKGPIATGDEVVDSFPRLKQLEKQSSRFFAIEMEGAGAIEAIHNLLRKPGQGYRRFIAVRGISDLCAEKTDDFQKAAAAIAAGFSSHLLIQDLELEKSGTSVSVPEQLIKPAEGFHSIPYEKNINFVGRRDILAQIDKNLETNDTGTVLISGMPGSGKTEVATRYAHEQKGKYPYIFWLNGDSAEQLEAGMFKIASILGLASPGIPNEVLTLKVQEWLQKNNNYLLIVDNANNLHKLPEFIPPTREGKLLITSQKNKSYSGGSHIRLPNLGNDESLNLLLQQAERNFSNDQKETDTAERLVSRFQGHALATVQAGAYVKATGCTFAEYEQLLNKSGRETLAIGIDIDEKSRKSVTESLDVTLSQLKLEEHRKAYETLKLFSLMDPHYIPRPLAERMKIPGKAIAVLNQYHLVETQGDRYIIHPLIQELVQGDLTSEEKKQFAQIILKALNEYFEFLRSSQAPITKESWDTLKDLLCYAPICEKLIKEYPLAELGEVLFHFATKQNFIFNNPESAKKLYRTGIEHTNPSLQKIKAQVQLGALEENFAEAIKAIEEYMDRTQSPEEVCTLKRYLMNIQHHTKNHVKAKGLADELIPLAEGALRDPSSAAMEYFLTLEATIPVLLEAGEKEKADRQFDRLIGIYAQWDLNQIKKHFDAKMNLPWERKESCFENLARLQLLMISDTPAQAALQREKLEELYNRAFEAYITEFGNDEHYLVGRLYEKMGDNYQAMNDPKSQEYFSKAKTLYEKFFPDNHAAIEKIKFKMVNP